VFAADESLVATFARWCDAEHVVRLANGRDALLRACSAALLRLTGEGEGFAEVRGQLREAIHEAVGQPHGGAGMSRYRERAEGFEAGQAATGRPACVADDHLEFLDALRESGDTNMFGARPYLMAEFPLLSDEEAATVMGYWMKTFGNPKR